MASERPGVSGSLWAQASTDAMNSSDSRNVRDGSLPVGGRPAPGLLPPIVFGIAFFTFWSYLIQA
jgi:hypothetical protein